MKFSLTLCSSLTESRRSAPTLIESKCCVKENYIFSGGLLVHNLRSSLGEIQNWSPHKEDKERPKKEADHSRLVGGRFSK